jgi:hypothetical protein
LKAEEALLKTLLQALLMKFLKNQTQVLQVFL